MENIEFTENDWKFFRNRITDWQESYMDRLCKEYMALLSGEERPSEKFWRLEKRMKKDRRNAGVKLVMSRSNLVYNVASLLKEGAIACEDLEEFSDKLKETVNKLR
ncbi:multidrug transporter [Lactovum odontotermitis]